ncbi:Lipopolysaccharide 1,2-glucosyltransferase [Suttonella ornithocola]|uniref:Lipopolysaccharide 1,2-glucosyltransferase n=1 Tax=Suttonella ornithocola TaxID=279832 RepID=A0A380MRR6_9GAMM|nr:Lipopolysaccharide 1,2-glucosyltransferase [Suttonella ornithocola]
MPEVMIDYAPKYLYLDADILVIGKLAPLIDWDMQDKTIAGAPISDEQAHRTYFANFWNLKSGMTINAGIMLVDAKRWIEKGYTEKVFAFRGKPTKMFIGHDQDIINMALDGDITYLPRQYNDEAGRQRLAGKESVILHFVGRIKPWKVALEVSPLISEWRKYAKLSQWDAPETALPPKIPKNYYYFKFAANYLRERKQWFRALYAYLTYLQLKSRQSLQQK